MDLSSPISSVIPTAHGAVLAVLARTDEPLSGRRIADLTQGRFGQSRVNQVLGELADSGVVLREERPPSKLYRLNRDHVAATGIVALAEQWTRLLGRIRDDLSSWAVPAEAGWLYGSAARGDATRDSDIDILLITKARDDNVEGVAVEGVAVEDVWAAQVADLSDRIRAWSGNTGEILELSGDELRRADQRNDRLVADLRDHAVPLTGTDVQAWLNRSRRPGKARQ